MNETPEVKPQPSTSETTAPQGLAEAVATLQVQLQATLILLIMITGALNIYLLRQYVALRKDVAVLEPQVGQMMAVYDKVTIPLARTFLGQLTEFARQHPDFQPILNRYQVQVIPGTGAPPASAPAATGSAPPTASPRR
ncbi:hypothetical protein [Limisphaera sp. VF-2]|jgi:hypothetical protein|uniref:hypothetical protein n=1 Tax=Limisphaera sp. VF-2 TaxID=3400418 RepID=UPI001771E3D7